MDCFTCCTIFWPLPPFLFFMPKVFSSTAYTATPLLLSMLRAAALLRYAVVTASIERQGAAAVVWN